MSSPNGLKRFNGGAPALIRHVVAILGVLIVAAFTVGVFLTNIENSAEATEKKATENRKRVQAIEESINEVATQQKLLNQQSTTDREHSKEFRDNTRRALQQILNRLPRQERPAR